MRSTSGVDTVILHEKKTSTILDLVTNRDEDESLEPEKVALEIKSETKNVSGIKDKYPALDKISFTVTILPTLNDTLITISPKLKDNSKSFALISSNTTTVASSKVSMLQVA